MKKTRVIFLCLIALFMISGCTSKQGIEKQRQAEEEERLLEEEMAHEEYILNVSQDDVSPADFEDWREYHEFKLSMVADNAEPVDSKYLDMIGYCAPYSMMGGLRADEKTWLVYEAIEQDLFDSLMSCSTAEEFDTIFNERINGKKDARVYELNEQTQRYEYVWDLTP